MSYDLYFVPADGSPAPGAAAMRDHFSSRAWYSFNGAQAWYENKDTGVYFSFYLVPPEEPSEVFGRPAAIASFNMNFARPHVFALEAEPEVSAFVEAFGFRVDDLQTEELRVIDYSADVFIDGWNRGNDAGCGMLLEHEGAPVFERALPSSLIEGCWRWNLDRIWVQKELGEDVFVPKVIFVVRDGAVVTATTWTDAVPTLLPEVDLYFIVRMDLAPRRLFGKKHDLCLVDRAALEPLIAQHERRNSAGLPSRWLGYSEAPAELTRWVAGLAPSGNMPQGIAFDCVLDSEVLRPVGGV